MGCSGSKSAAADVPSLRNGASAQKVIQKSTSTVSNVTATDHEIFDNANAPNENEEAQKALNGGAEGEAKEEEGDQGLLDYLGQMSNSFSQKEPVSSITAGLNVGSQSPSDKNKKPQRRVSGISTEVISRLAEGGQQRRSSAEARRNSSLLAPPPDGSPEARRMSSIHAKRMSSGGMDPAPEAAAPAPRSGLSKLWGPAEQQIDTQSSGDKGFTSVLTESNAAGETQPKKKNGLSKLWGDADVLVDDVQAGSAVAQVIAPYAPPGPEPASATAPVPVIPDDVDAFLDEHGNLVYLDANGNTVDMNGNIMKEAAAEATTAAMDIPDDLDAFVDEHGNLVYCDKDGNVVDPNSPPQPAATPSAAATESAVHVDRAQLHAFQDENGNVVYCDAEGNIVPDPNEQSAEQPLEPAAPAPAPASSDLQAFQDEHGNIVYCDADGNVAENYTAPTPVEAAPVADVQAFQDEHGNIVYCDADGNVVTPPVDAIAADGAVVAPVAAEGAVGEVSAPPDQAAEAELQAFQDENGNIVYCDAAGNVVPQPAEQAIPEPEAEATESGLQAFQDEEGNIVYCDANGNIVSRGESAATEVVQSSEIQAYQDENGNIVYCDANGNIVPGPEDESPRVEAASEEVVEPAAPAQEEAVELQQELMEELAPAPERQYTQVQAYNDEAGNIVFCDPDGNVVPQSFALPSGSTLQAYLGEGGSIVFCNENGQIVADAVDLYRESVLNAAAPVEEPTPAEAPKKKAGNIVKPSAEDTAAGSGSKSEAPNRRLSSEKSSKKMGGGADDKSKKPSAPARTGSSRDLGRSSSSASGGAPAPVKRSGSVRGASLGSSTSRTAAKK